VTGLTFGGWDSIDEVAEDVAEGAMASEAAALLRSTDTPMSTQAVAMGRPENPSRNKVMPIPITLAKGSGGTGLRPAPAPFVEVTSDGVDWKRLARDAQMPPKDRR
jgi:hypothetical protein